MTIPDSKIKFFRRKIFVWWKTHRRDLPWRHTHDPYKILVSEVMLQQTQVSRVLPKYDEFLSAFPDVQTLAAASPAEVLKIWKGMGYNRRALYLKKTATAVIEEHKGIFPKRQSELIKLPGLGKYTARAVLVFAYKENVAMVDTNIRQIITHFFFHDRPQKESVIQEVADQLLPKGKSWEWHQALMDYGNEYNSEFKIQNSKLKKKQKPFRESNRFYRGRIIDRLRDGDIVQSQLLKEFSKKYQKSESFLISIISKLKQDGLISGSKTGTLSLPNDTPSL